MNRILSFSGTDKSSEAYKIPGISFPRFSVIVLTYMQRYLLNECLDSILSQTYPDIELVVCDDCSADFEVKEVQKYIDENKKDNIKRIVVYKQERNVGIVRNAKKGVDLSSGTYIKLHAGDDMLFDENVLSKMSLLLGKSEVHVVAARCVACEHDGKMTEHYYPSMEAMDNMARADAQEQFELIGTQSWGEYVSAPAAFWTREIYDKIGGFDLSCKYTEDWPMWLKITGAGYPITIVDEVTTIYRYGGISNSESMQNLTLGKTHYQEIISSLEKYVLPRLEEEGKKKKAIRCRQAIQCLEVRMEVEGEWDYWTSFQQIGWRLRNLRFCLLSWLYRRRKHGIMLNRKGQLVAMAVSILLYALHVEVWPDTSCDEIWALCFFVAFLWLAVKETIAVGIGMMNQLMKFRGGKK